MPPHRPPTEPFVLEPVATALEVRAEWDALALAAGNPFGTFEWAAAWWAVHGPGRELALRRVRTRSGRIAALLPLYRADRGPLPLLRFVGHGAADELGPLCAPADRPLAAAGLRRAAGELPRHGLLVAERLPRDAGLGALLGARVVRREASPVLEAGGRTWEAWLATRSPNLRQQARRFERRLARAHELRFRLTDDPRRLDEDLETLFALHDLRWGPEGGSSAFSRERRALHRDFARRALGRGWLRLWIAEVDGAPGAAWYGLRYAGREWYYQLGRDPAWDRLRLGFVLLVHTIREALADGVRAYHFGLGPEPYKARFATGDPGLETVVAGRPRTTWAAGAAAGALARMPAGLRGAVGRRVA